eukprot:CAMPEP_0203957648 /NCGR_PEP_ID=MMETSP0359-20131031/89424_1 /ASSEMBLY_ACC=CAM_ASM_000338 /TAXON_ID=268821 /ORGANISM="Scrippsiella Hangoei, Strain SHTV-5" /LENGTH=37 /DNA_ID= /DNA_START= /DNA_END= /DNA_ORIENTATION=
MRGEATAVTAEAFRGEAAAVAALDQRRTHADAGAAHG